MSAWSHLCSVLEDGEAVEAVVFGTWDSPFEHLQPKVPIPEDRIGRVLTAEQAEPLMQAWELENYGGEAYAVYVWTNRRVFFLFECESGEGLRSVPRHPIAVVPERNGSDSGTWR